MSNENTWLTGPHHGLADLNHRALKNLMGNHWTTAPAVVIGSGTLSAIDYTAFGYTVGGRVYALGTGTDEALTVLDYYGPTVVQAADTTCFYVVSVNAAGDENVTKGKDDETTELPGIPDTECFIALIKIVTVAVTFTIGTDSFAKAGCTDTFYNYLHAPAEAP